MKSFKDYGIHGSGDKYYQCRGVEMETCDAMRKIYQQLYHISVTCGIRLPAYSHWMDAVLERVKLLEKTTEINTEESMGTDVSSGTSLMMMLFEKEVVRQK